MQTLVLAAVLAVAAAATIPDQEPLLTALKLPVFGFFHRENDTITIPTEQLDHQPTTTTTTISQPDEQLTISIHQPDEQPTTITISQPDEQLTITTSPPPPPPSTTTTTTTTTTISQPKEQLTADAQSTLSQPDETFKNHEKPLNQSTQQRSSQPETLAVDAMHTTQEAGVNSSHDTPQSNSSHAVQESPLAEQAVPVKEEAAISSQAPQSDNTPYSTPSPKRGSETTTAKSLEPLNLPSGANFMLGAISTTFSCLDRPYGYYADPDNNCHVFHVCNPSYFPDGSVRTYQYSFMCGEGTVFDQKEMTCVAEWAATPCAEASSFYLRNQEFGQVQGKLP